MSLAADIQELKAVFNLQDNASGSAAKIKAQMSGLGAASGVATGALSAVERGATGMGNAFNHAKGFLGGLVSGPLGFLGLGAAAFSLAGALKNGIDTANTMAISIEKLTALTGESAQAMSGLLAVTGKFGLSADQVGTIVGFEEKTVGKLAETMSGKGSAATSKLLALQKLYGVSLTDSKGKALDFSTILNHVSDYYNSNATQGQKAALAATLFGRGYAALIPVLQLGSKGFAEAQAAAEKLGLTITAQNATDLKNYQENWRELGDAVGGLQLQMSLALLPTLNDVAKSITAFVTNHRTDLIAFFKGGIVAAREIGAALVGVGKAAAGVWNSIPGPLRDLMIQALVGNKVIKTVFGINILGTVEGAVANIGKDLLGKVVGGIFGKTIATPVVNVDGAVVNVAGGGLGNLAGGAAGAAEGAGGAAATAGGGAALGGLAAAATGAAIAGATLLVPILEEINHKKGDPYSPLQAKFAPLTFGASQKTSLLTQIQNTILTQGAAHAAQAAQTADEDSSHLRLAMQSAAQGAAAKAELLHAALANLTGLTKTQLNTVSHNIQLQTIAAEHVGKVTFAELEHLSHVAHEDHISQLAKIDHLTIVQEKARQVAETGVIKQLAKFDHLTIAEEQVKFALNTAAGRAHLDHLVHMARVDHLTIQQELTKLAAQRLLAPLYAINSTLVGIGHGGGGLAAGGGSGMGGRGGSQGNQGGTTHRSNTQAGSTANRYGKVLGL